jgi:hypothetical protein
VGKGPEAMDWLICCVKKGAIAEYLENVAEWGKWVWGGGGFDCIRRFHPGGEPEVRREARLDALIVNWRLLLGKPPRITGNGGNLAGS